MANVESVSWRAFNIFAISSASIHLQCPCCEPYLILAELIETQIDIGRLHSPQVLLFLYCRTPLCECSYFILCEQLLK